MESKKCCRCKIVKDIKDFYKNKTRKDGFQPECSQCKYELYFLSKEKLFPKVTCACGKTIYKYYLEKHLKTKYHAQHEIKVE
jgi:hypothetical protein